MALTLDDAFSAMRAAGMFYVMERRGLTPALWRRSEKQGAAPVTPGWLTAWLQQYVSIEATRALAAQALSSELTRFQRLTHATAELL